MDSLHQTVFVYPLTPIGGRSSDVFPPVCRQAGRNGRADEAGRPYDQNPHVPPPNAVSPYGTGSCQTHRDRTVSASAVSIWVLKRRR